MTSNDRGATGQVSRSAAEVYEDFFVPALFAQWCDRVADAAGVRAGQRVLDVACGTGALARCVAGRIGASGAVVGLDVNAGMLDVARRASLDRATERATERAPAAAPIEWREAPAEQLPFGVGSFDAVVSQFGLMYFTNRATAIAEMARVLRPGGKLAVAVWSRLSASPGYSALTELLQQLFGDAAADSMRAPFCLGDTRELAALFAVEGLRDVRVTTHDGMARFESIEAMVRTEIKGWTLADTIDDRQYDQLLTESQTRLARFADGDGRVSFPVPAHIVTAVRA